MRTCTGRAGAAPLEVVDHPFRELVAAEGGGHGSFRPASSSGGLRTLNRNVRGGPVFPRVSCAVTSSLCVPNLSLPVRREARPAPDGRLAVELAGEAGPRLRRGHLEAGLAVVGPLGTRHLGRGPTVSTVKSRVSVVVSGHRRSRGRGTSNHRPPAGRPCGCLPWCRGRSPRCPGRPSTRRPLRSPP